MSHSKIDTQNRSLLTFSETEIQEAIVSEKAIGTSDQEIGRRYGVSFREIERAVTKVKGVNVSAVRPQKSIHTFSPTDFKEEQTTVWSFKRRGNWATHSGEYRGNWSPYIPRNLILRYSKPGEIVLDYFCGAGTTAVETKLLGRKCIALDINDKAIELARRNVAFLSQLGQPLFSDDQKSSEIYEPELFVGDARNLSNISANSIDFICSHPPYANIIHYTNNKTGDLSFFTMEAFITEMRKVAAESFRTLKHGRQCAILIGDMRKSRHVIPLGFSVVQTYLDAGFKLRELIIKRQHNCRTTGFWYNSSIRHNFLLLAHEYLPIFEKPQISQESVIREEPVIYNDFASLSISHKKREKLDVLETSTVWILPSGKSESQPDTNVINRYSDGKHYKIIRLDTESDSGETFITQKHVRDSLLFVKPPRTAELTSQKVGNYLKKLETLIVGSKVSPGGFVVVQTYDVRIDNYIEPLAMRILQMVNQKSLWLKEIIILTKNDASSLRAPSSNNLLISHEYLLVYEVTR